MSDNYAGQQMRLSEWRLNGLCNRYAEDCSPLNGDLANSLASHWFSLCRNDSTLSPRQLALQRCPNLFTAEYQRRLNKLKFRRGI